MEAPPTEREGGGSHPWLLVVARETKLQDKNGIAVHPVATLIEK